MTPGTTRAAMALAGALAVAALAFLAPRSPSPGAGARPDPSPPPGAPAPPAPAAHAAAPAEATPDTAPVPTPAPPPPVPAPHPPPVPAPPPPEETETSLTERIRALVDADPGAAVGLVDDAARRFPAGSLGDERSFLKMRALVHLGRIGDARGEAEAFFERFPESPWGASAYRLTGVHPRPAPPSSAPTGRGR